MTQNPLWPVLDYAICFSAGPHQTSVQDHWASVSDRTEGTTAISRGKQYELDQTQPGEMTLTLRNDDGLFDPDNATSPWAGGIDLYRLIRLRAQYPATLNLLTAGQATAGSVVFDRQGNSSSLAVGLLPDTVTAPPGITAGVDGAGHYSIAVGAGPAVLLSVAGFSVTPGVTYTAQHVVANASGAASRTVRLALGFVDVHGNVISAVAPTGLATSATGAVQSCTFTAPPNAAGGFVQLSASAGTATTILSSHWQLEVGASASAWVQPSPWYPLFTGYIERWPQSWSSQGNYGVVNLTCVDQFTAFAARDLPAPFLADLLALRPTFLYPLNEGAGATVFQDATGNRAPATISAPGAPLISAGVSVASGSSTPAGDAHALSGAFLGHPGPVLDGAVYPSGTTWLVSSGALKVGADVSGRVGPTASNGVTRIIATRGTIQPTDSMFAWSYTDGSGNSMALKVDASTLAVTASSSSSIGSSVSSGFSVASLGAGGVLTDTDWHLWAVSISADGLSMTTWVDGDTAGTAHTVTATATVLPQLTAAGLDLIAATGSGSTSSGQWVGNLSTYCELPFAMTAEVWLDLWSSWRNGWASSAPVPETAGDRYSRILRWLGYTGPSSVSAGLTANYGPAVDVPGAKGLPGLQTVVESEGGQHYVAADGAIVFQGREDRYNKSPVMIFGERSDYSEASYGGAVTDYDPTRLANDVAVTATYGGVTASAADGPPTEPGTSQYKYGVFAFTRTVNTTSPTELNAAAQYYLYTNKDPMTRLESLPLNVGAAPWLWPTLLGLDLGECVGFRRRPSGAPSITLNGFIEKITWSLNDQLGAEFDGQISNGKKLHFGVWGTALWGADPGSITVSAATSASATTIAFETANGFPMLTTTAGSYPLTVAVDGENIILPAAPTTVGNIQTYTGVTRGANGTPPAEYVGGEVLSIPQQGTWAY